MRIPSLLLGALIAMACGQVSAQEMRLTLGLELAVPTGEFNELQGMGVGGTLGFEVPAGPLGIIVQSGFMNFSGKDLDDGQTSTMFPDLQVIPIQAGARYYFIEDQLGPYAGAMVGVHLTNCEGCEARTNISYAPLLGFMITENFDIGLRYQFMSIKSTISTATYTHSYLALRVAYGF
jgi:hypothetical protein